VDGECRLRVKWRVQADGFELFFISQELNKKDLNDSKIQEQSFDDKNGVKISKKEDHKVDQ